MHARTLEPGDEAALLAFLDRHPHTTMFLASNLARGLSGPGADRYEAVEQDGRIAGVVSRSPGGMLLTEAPVGLELLAPRVAAEPVLGLIGRPEQTERLRALLGLSHAATQLDRVEVLMILPLDEVVVPDILARARVACRPARSTDRDQLVAWRAAYQVEAVGEPAGADNDAKAAGRIDRQLATAALHVLLRDRRLVAMTAFNARHADQVQVGGVWTPPPQRRQGYARAVVAGSLAHERARGATLATLFAHDPHAIRAYTALGFRDVGRYGLTLFA